MSVSTVAGPAQTRPATMARRLAVAMVAIGAVTLVVWLIAFWLAPAASAPARNPFGMGVREAAPSGPLGALILSMQAGFYRSLQGAVLALKANGALLPLLAIGFAYGVFHAAGPGHGKAVVSAYLVAGERALARGMILSLAAALIQAIVAIAVVGVASLALRATAATMNGIAGGVELASFALVAGLGAVLTWRKAGALLGVVALARDPYANVAQDCGHAHLPPPAALARLNGLRQMAAVALAAGIRPCSGALIVLVFSWSQGLFLAGIGATFAMALGTALTTGAIATISVFAKALALRWAGGRGARGAIAVAGIELAAAAFVFVLGASLLFGIWTFGAAS